VIDFLSSILDAIVAITLVWAILRALRNLFHGPAQTSVGAGKRRNAASAAAGGETARDPVCGMFVSTELSHRLVEDGKTIHFCSAKCRESYQKSAVKV
jgi:YHS domain-containing protein